MKEYNQEQRIKSAKERQKERKNRNPLQQIKELDIRLGEGEGAIKERNKLQKIISKNEK